MQLVAALAMAEVKVNAGLPKFHFSLSSLLGTQREKRKNFRLVILFNSTAAARVELELPNVDREVRRNACFF